METRKRTATSTTTAKIMVPLMYKRKETSTQRKRRLKKAKDKRDAKKALQILEKQRRLDAMRFQSEVDPMGLMEIRELQDQYSVIKQEETVKLDPVVIKSERRESHEHCIEIKSERDTEYPEPSDDHEELKTHSKSEFHGFAGGVIKDDKANLQKQLLENQMLQIKREHDDEENQNLLDELRRLPEPQDCYYNEVYLTEVKLEAQDEEEVLGIM